MTSGSQYRPDDQQVERFADSLHDRLCRFANSWGIVDVSVETDGAHIDGESIFALGPDIGFTIDMSVGVSRYCELIGDTDERWLDVEVAGVDDDVELQVTRVTDGILEARRAVTSTTPSAEGERS